MLRIESHLPLFWLLPLAGRVEGFASPSERPDLLVSKRDKVDGTLSNRLSLGRLPTRDSISVLGGAASLALSAWYPSLTLFFFGGAFLNRLRPFCRSSRKYTSVSFSIAVEQVARHCERVMRCSSKQNTRTQKNRTGRSQVQTRNANKQTCFYDCHVLHNNSNKHVKQHVLRHNERIIQEWCHVAAHRREPGKCSLVSDSESKEKGEQTLQDVQEGRSVGCGHTC